MADEQGLLDQIENLEVELHDLESEEGEKPSSPTGEEAEPKESQGYLGDDDISSFEDINLDDEEAGEGDYNKPGGAAEAEVIVVAGGAQPACGQETPTQPKVYTAGLGGNMKADMPGIDSVCSLTKDTNHTEQVEQPEPQKTTPVVSRTPLMEPVYTTSHQSPAETKTANFQYNPYDNTATVFNRMNAHEMNSSVVVRVEEVLGEPDVPGRSPDCVWNTSRMCFHVCRLAWYSALATVCAIPAGALYGCAYGRTAFCHVWCLTPRLRAWKENMRKLGRFWGAAVQCCCQPCCVMAGTALGNISRARRQEALQF